jgi:hypothetical protein
VQNFNTAAAALSPPRKALDVHKVLDHVFLAEFDLLRDSRYQVMKRPWAQPAERSTMAAFYKLQRSQEEIQHLDVEACQLATYIEDEEHDLAEHHSQLLVEEPSLAYQVQKLRESLVAVNKVHWRRLERLQQLDGFTGNLTAGQHVGRRSQHHNLETTSAMEEPDDNQQLDEDVDDDNDNAVEAIEKTIDALTLDDRDVY